MTAPRQVDFFEVETGSIAYELLDASEAGAGAPTLTLIHNFMSTGRSAWGPLLGALNRSYRILLPDLPGHGQSKGHPPGYHHQAMARQVAALMHATAAAVGGHLAGCSSGGMIAQLLVHMGLAAPRTLTLVSTTHSTNPHTVGAPLQLMPEQFSAGPKWMEATARLHDPYHGDGYYRRKLLPGFRALKPESTVDLSLDMLAAFNLPVCLVHGDEDEIFPVEIARDMAGAFPDAELHEIEGQGHALLFRRPAKIAKILNDFLTRRGG